MSFTDERKVPLSGQPPAEGMETEGAPQPINPATGQHYDYWVLSDEERAKGFVRPVRQTYRHVGTRPKYPTRPPTDEEKERDPNYVLYEDYPESERPVIGRGWTETQLNSGCGAVTTMALPIAETYARDPKFYGRTFCVGCRTHLPVDEFVWVDEGQVLKGFEGSQVGS